jgi:drug/metabolite transporter (DMT)-like permease
MIGSMVSSFIGAGGTHRKTFISSLIGDDAHHEHRSKGKLNPVLIIIPTIFDLSETLCSNIALTMIAASITQMLRATLIIFTACFSVWILHMKLYRHHYLSLGLILIGLISVGLS